MKRKLVRVKGVVQGVGFRPFLYRLAHEYHIVGTVQNDAHGVLLDAQGENDNLESFILAIEKEAPPLARITQISVEEREPGNLDSFKIIQSSNDIERSVLISPDVATCDDCLREIFNKDDRRYRYPFTNCTNCGPRYTITADIPYDRPNTTMASFKMCQNCQREYDDPTDRRFHAQPNACPVCGPMVSIHDAMGDVIPTDDPLERAVEYLKKGKILAIKGLGGFHLAVDALNEDAVVRLRKRKHREEKPFAIMSPDIVTIEKFAHVSSTELRLLTSHERPIVLLRKKGESEIAESVSPGNAFVGVMLPYTPLHHLILRNNFTALVMTSGNYSEEPIAKDNQEALDRLGAIADYFLMHNRDILIRSDDTVMRVLDNSAIPVRRARGYVPFPIFLKDELPEVLACGAELKNTICFSKGNHAFLSQHIGDLENMETYSFLKESIVHLSKILQVNPKIIVHDLHPQYLSTQWAVEQQDIEKIAVQHHHAHIAACLAENQVNEKVIGVAFDGTGYGEDSTIWGGEILIADLQNYTRAAHFDVVPIPSGERAIKEPWRMALSYLYHAFGEELFKLKIPFVKSIKRSNAEKLLYAMKRNLNSPLTSSCGRLFDGIAALCGIRHKVSFEGQAAMEFEMVMYENRNIDDIIESADTWQGSRYSFFIEEENDALIIKYESLIKAIIQDIVEGVQSSEISFQFHTALVQSVLEVCERLREKYRIELVALSGGCFQNAFLATIMPRMLKNRNFKVFTHRLLPPNDGCISLGQAAIAGKKLKFRMRA